MLRLPNGSFVDPRTMGVRRSATSATSGLALLEELFRGLAKTAPVLPEMGNQPSQAADNSQGLNFNTPRIENLLGNRGSREGGRNPLL